MLLRLRLKCSLKAHVVKGLLLYEEIVEPSGNAAYLEVWTSFGCMLWKGIVEACPLPLSLPSTLALQWMALMYSALSAVTFCLSTAPKLDKQKQKESLQS